MIENHGQKAAVSNAMVIAAFISGTHAHSANLSTDGSVLRSYHYYELAIWANKDEVILRAGELYSKTTTKHMSLLKKALDRAKVKYTVSTIESPQESKSMYWLRAQQSIEEEESAEDELPPPMFDRFDVCAAYLVFEWNYHRGGIDEYRPSNRRRNMSTDFQLKRMGYSPGAAFNGYESLSDNGKAIYHNLEERYKINRQTEVSIYEQ